MVQLTPAARQEIDRLRHRQNQADAICRLGLQPSSCAQWAYTLSLVANADADDDIYEFLGLRVAISQSHAAYIKGLRVDFSEDLTGGAFRFDNPQATESCRCGYAFAIRQEKSALP